MNPIVTFALRQRLMILAVLALFLIAGFFAFKQLNIEAYPDPVPPRVEIIAQTAGLSAQEIERTITIPIEIQLAGIKNVTKVETMSLFGLSDIRVQFTYDYTYEEAQQRVLNQLSQLPPLPNGTQPQISPTSPVGEIYRYQVTGPKGYSVTDLKTIQDWILQRRFKAVPGVIDVNGWAGKSKTYEITVDQHKLVGYGLSLPQVLSAINNANVNVGGQTINIGPQAAVVRGVGLIHTLDDIRNTMVSPNNGKPVLVSDIATVQIGNIPRLGIVGRDNDDDIVQGVILMRRGEESLPTLQRVEAEVEKINNEGILPPGVHLDKIYDRTELIDVTIHTVLENMIMGIALIFAVQWIFLGSPRSALIVAATIPFALAFAVILMVIQGESANLLSIGAIDFGLIVDATVIMVENIYRHLSQHSGDRFGRGLLDRMGGIPTFSGKLGVIALSASEVNRAIFFAAAIIIAGFLPLFTLTGVEGHIFGPMARTYAYGIMGGLIATFTVTPVLSYFMLRDKEEEKETWLVRKMRKAYDPALRFALANRILAMGGMAALLVAAGIAVTGLGLEFLPKLEEGNFWVRATMPNSVGLEEAQVYTNRMRHILMKFPEVKTVVSQLGRPDDGTDTTGFSNAEFYVPLKPASEWPGHPTKEQLTKQVSDELSAPFPGVSFEFSQTIEDNVEEAASGVKGQNSVKLYGNDLDAIQKAAYQIKGVLAGVRGVSDLTVFDAVGQPTVNIKVDRLKAAKYGLAPGDINTVIQAAVGGQAASGNVYEYGSDRNFPIIIRLAPQYRANIDAIRNIPVAGTNAGGGVTQIPLSAVADIQLVAGYSLIYRENQSRYIPIGFAVRGRDLGSAILEAQQKIDKLNLPAGSRLEWVGEFGELQNALSRLEVVVPIAFLAIGVLLFINFGSLRDTLLAASVMPMALVGGIFALYFTGIPFSVSAAIGFIGLFGISVMGGILVLSYYNQMLMVGMPRDEAILHAARTQFRPVMMTCIAACVGLLPAAVATGIGSQVQKPLALVVVGGILLAPILILVVLPAMISTFSKRPENPHTRPPLPNTGTAGPLLDPDMPLEPAE